MKQYIDKDALVAEIERKIKVSQDYAKCNLTEKTRIGNHAQLLELNDILSFINTLEVKEVDLEQEIDDYIGTKEVWEIQEAPLISIENAAKHFFELGLRVQKGV